MSAIKIEETLYYINLVRTNPVKFAEFIKADIDSFISDTQMPLLPNCYYQVNESKKTWVDCYDFLLNQQPLPPFQLSQSLNLAAQDHAKDLAATGGIGHTGSDGSTMAQRIQRRSKGQWSGNMAENVGSDFLVEGRDHALKTVVGLIVDDGVASRGHRKNILSGETKYIGIYSAVQGDKIITVMNFLSVNLPPKQFNSVNQSKQDNQLSYGQPKIHQLGKNKKPKNFANFQKFNQMMGDGGMGQMGQMGHMGHMGQMGSKSSYEPIAGKGGKYAVSKSMSTSTSTVNGKTVKKTVQTIKYSDGTVEENENIETYG